MADELVHLAVADGVATVTLDSQHNRNALSRRLVGELDERLATAGDHPDVRVVVVAAEGPAFCAGADLKEASDDGMEQGSRAMVAMQRRIVALPVPVVVRLQGPVRAGGLGIVGAADVVVAAESVSFSFTEVRLALAPAVISLTTLPRMGDRAAALHFLTADTFDAHEAARLGLVTRAVADADLDAAVEQVVALMRDAPRQGLSETKALLAAPLLERIDALGDDLAARSARLFGSDEARAAMRAFLSRR
ncbi:enoyl-CoA hydratase-related protein [Solicola sp. PLA-1-18]|uniref:enoyl-CoA hydratase-related protein n=1 Tax=Solicola sp. PLA-1-18 TaxID=3380532 RepID=UPI003B7DFB42